MYGETLLERLIQQIYEAAVGDTGWTSFLHSLGSALHSGFPSIFFVDPTNRKGSIAISIGMDEKHRLAYEEYYHERNVWLQGAYERDLLRSGIIRSSHSMCSRKHFLRSEWCADFCRPLNWTQGLGATILQEGSTTANVGVFTDNRRPPFGGVEIVLLKSLMPHLQRGLQVHQRLVLSQSRGQALEAVLHGLSTPVFLVTAVGQVFFMNAPAERLIRTSDGLLMESGELRAFLSSETHTLRVLITGAAEATGKQCATALKSKKPGGTLRISRPYGRDPLEVLVSPLPSRHDDWILRQPPLAAIFVTDQSRLHAGDSIVARLHGLTLMETRVAGAVSRGLAGKEICRELEISYNTLKTHLKHIYAKTHARHQTDLVRVLASPPQIREPSEGGKS